MSLLQQLLWGSLVLILCLILETAILLLCAKTLKRLVKRFGAIVRPRHTTSFIFVALSYVIFAHTLQVWIWSSGFVLSGALPDWNTAVYFSLVTYTTLGYGDVILGPAMRIFAAFSAVTGLLGFGISTAFLVGAIGHIFVVDNKVDGDI
ncbi:two pore domain potassium channel family protein [Parasedimentitalea marina]|uniref:Two pore domain potassium channel family protein n=1 Tax=Parasedimentitalea marina TaxID=2483033 RepID=A0A3T0N2R3_9RHOB|nr:potassium channel family protein [Parasedimentitalea marina]AZV78305.1 two pore domain potassium channel family protein [Parasedimentitalea marina]